MPEREPMNPNLAAALRAYEVEMRDGTERSQKAAFERLRIAQRMLGSTAVSRTERVEQPPQTTSEEQLAAS